jgi:hypothetical protein
MSNQYYLEGRARPGSQAVFIAIPVMDGKPEPQCTMSLLGAFRLLDDAGIRYDLSLEVGNCHVDDARNGLVRVFRETDCTDLVFIDADVGFDPAALLRLLQHDADVVAGVYPKKEDPANFPVKPLSSTENVMERRAVGGLVEVEGAPTGFMRISRSAIEKMVEANKHRQFRGQNHPPDAVPYTILFERTYEDGHRWSGDYAFCRKWRELGGKVYVDPEMDFAHVGAKEWRGRLGDHWRREAGFEPVRFVQAMERLKAGDPKPEDFVTLHEAWGNPWAGSPELLIAAYTMAKRAKGPVLETGSGLTTLVMAAAGAKVTALEHDLSWYRRLDKTLASYGLEADLHYVALDKYDGWYLWEPQEDYALLLCDGPPRNQNYSARSRAMTFPQVQGADWIVDDAISVAGRPYTAFGEDRKFVVAPKPKAVDLDALADDMARMEAVAF